MFIARLPETSLDFYGYSSPSEIQKDLEKLVETNNLKNVVNFKGYQSRGSARNCFK